MDYTKAEQQNGDIILTDIKNFNLSQVLDCGQCFRWSGTENSYKGIAYGRLLELSLKEGNLILKNVSMKEFESIWQDYFDLNRSYIELRQQYALDKTLKKAIVFSPGLRLMKQEPWEILITFILSQNSNIPRIKGMVARLCENFGKKLPCGDFTFPKPENLASLTAADLAPIKTGYRAEYILDAARKAASGNLNLEDMQNLPSDELRVKLMEIHGVGPKVADCVMLYGFNRIECYPLDVWMKRVMAEYYPEGFPPDLAKTAGIAQQFLFHYIRTAP